MKPDDTEDLKEEKDLSFLPAFCAGALIGAILDRGGRGGRA
jgi:hypothetical protein